MRDTGKSSSRKLRRVVQYLLYRMDPQKTHYKISFSTKMSKIQNSVFFFNFPPLKGPISPFKGPPLRLLKVDQTLGGMPDANKKTQGHLINQTIGILEGTLNQIQDISNLRGPGPKKCVGVCKADALLENTCVGYALYIYAHICTYIYI